MKQTIAVLVLAAVAGCSGPRPLPRQSEYSNRTDFLRARVEYFTSDWVRRHPDKSWHYTPAVPLVQVTNGVWGMEAGPAVVSGHGLFVTVDDAGDLIEIEEIFNPD